MEVFSDYMTGIATIMVFFLQLQFVLLLSFYIIEVQLSGKSYS